MLTDQITKIVFIGEVDHGKSSLLARLTINDKAERVSGFAGANQAVGMELAHVVDQLAEERARGMTIDTTEIRLMLANRAYSLIDAPGHLELLRNMATGAARADAAILVIDVTAGVRPQTLRHLAAATLLGCREVVIVINKMDMVDYSQASFNEARESILSAMAPQRNLYPKQATVIPVSAKEGAGVYEMGDKLGWYKGHPLCSVLSQLRPASLEDLPVSFPVQDIYHQDGIDWIVGKVDSGVLRQGMRLKNLSTNQKFIVSSLLAYPRKVQSVAAGESVAIGLEPLGLIGGKKVLPSPGDVLCEVHYELAISSKASGNFIWLDDTPLKVGEELSLRCATQETKARVLAISPLRYSNEVSGTANEAVCFGDMAKIELSLTSPIVVDNAHQGVTALSRLVFMRDGRIAAGGQVQC